MRTRLTTVALVGLLAACGGDRAGSASKAAPAAPVEAKRVEGKREAGRGTDEPSVRPEPLPIGDEPLRNGKPSLTALGGAVVDALAAGDAEALWALAVSEQEYARLFGALASHPNMLRLGSTMAWANQLEDNRDGLRHAIERYGGKGYELVGLEPTRTEERGGLVVYRAPKLTVKDATGTMLELEVIGVVVEHVASRTFLVLTFAD